MTNKKLTTIIIAFVIVFTSCSKLRKSNTQDRILAEVSNSKLYKSKLKIAMPKNLGEKDSTIFANNYIEKWVCNQLILKKAEMYLDEKHLDEINMMLENYRTSLMVFNYQQMIIQQKIDTVVGQNEILEYYTNHSTNFILDSCAVKAIFVQLPKSVPDKYKLKRWMRSGTEDDLIKIEDYCYQSATNFDMGENWIKFSNLIRKTPKNIGNPEMFLKYNKFIESTDSLYKYYIQILNYKLSNDTQPVEFVENQIKSIILNHRKIELINKLENNIYNDALNQNKFTIYKE